MSEVLTKDEIDQLLSAISSGSEKDKKSSDGQSKKEISYDISCPDFLTRKERQLLCHASETAARKITDYVSRELKIKTHIRTVSLDVISCDDFLKSIPNPTFISSFKFLGEDGLFEVAPEISFGGLLKQKEIRNREPDGLDLKIIQNYFVKPVLKIISGTFCNLFHKEQKKIQKISVYSNPQFTEQIPYYEIGTLVTYEVKAGEYTGMMNLFFSRNLAKKLIHNDETLDVIPLKFSGQNLFLEMGRCNLSDADKLIPGKIIELNKSLMAAEKGFDVYKDGTKIGVAEILLIEQNFGLKFKDNSAVKDDCNSSFNTRVIIGGQFVNEEVHFETGQIIKLMESSQDYFRVEKDGKIIAFGEPLVLDKHLGLCIVKLVKED